VARAKQDHAARTQDNPYVCPVPAEVGPALEMALGR
jgi:aminobenzoyl-glutamate utilization protein B